MPTTFENLKDRRIAKLQLTVRQLEQCLARQKDLENRLNETLRKSERKLDSIVKTIPDIVYRLDPHGQINFISKGISRYGYAPDELLGKSIVHLIHPQDRTVAHYRINDRRTGARSTRGLEVRLLFNNDPEPTTSESLGGNRYFLVSAEGLYSDSGDAARQFIGTQGIAHDITLRKQSEIERTRLEAELNKARILEAIGTLAGGIAHDVNNLLMGIQGNVSLMRTDTTDARDHRQRLENIEQCVKRGSQLTHQLLGFSQSGKFNIKTIDINAVVSDTARLFGHTRKTIHIDQQLAGDLQPVDADQGQLAQVLLNIMVNADQAMPEGGCIRLSTRNVEPRDNDLQRLRLKPGPYVCIVIEDTGIGMNQETQRRIFEPFFTTKEMGHGTGLGLASAYGTIARHGGMIDVTSAPGRGSRFETYLPASSGKVAAKIDPAPGFAKGTGTILLVDDEDIIIDVCSKMLTKLGYRVICAASGSQAVQIFARQHKEIDMIVLDMIMPEMSGFETYRRLRKINPSIKVLLSSGYSESGPSREIIARDNQGFIQKPYQLEKLSQKLAAMLAKS